MAEQTLSERERHLRNLGAVAEHLFTQQANASAAPAREGQVTTRLRRWGAPGGLLAVQLGKLKWLLVVAKFLKLSTLLSMLLMVWVYATMWGVPFAVGFVLLIFVHELGHALVMRQQGIPAGPPVFIPFVGAVIAMRGLPRDAYVEAVVAIGGPLLGSLGAAVCLAAAVTTGERFWYALASTGFLINLFNLIPLYPLAGGRRAGGRAGGARGYRGTLVRRAGVGAPVPGRGLTACPPRAPPSPRPPAARARPAPRRPSREGSGARWRASAFRPSTSRRAAR